MSIRLEPIDERLRAAVGALRVTPEQEAYLDTPSLALFLEDAPLHPTFECRAILDADVVVGFVSFGYEPEDPSRGWIPLLVVDRDYQRRGYGRAALRLVVDALRERPRAFKAVGLSYKSANTSAGRLYLEMGFVPQAELVNGEVVAWLPLAVDGFSIQLVSTDDHAAAVLELFERNSEDATHTRAVLDEGQCELWLAIDGGETLAVLLGTHQVEREDGIFGGIENLLVDERVRRRGLGRKLMETAERHYQGIGLRGVQLAMNEDNRPAGALYRALGYQVTLRYTRTRNGVEQRRLQMVKRFTSPGVEPEQES